MQDGIGTVGPPPHSPVFPIRISNQSHDFTIIISHILPESAVPFPSHSLTQSEFSPWNNSHCIHACEMKATTHLSSHGSVHSGFEQLYQFTFKTRQPSTSG